MKGNYCQQRTSLKLQQAQYNNLRLLNAIHVTLEVQGDIFLHDEGMLLSELFQKIHKDNSNGNN